MNKELWSTGLNYVCSDAVILHNPWYSLGTICDKDYMAYLNASFSAKPSFHLPPTPLSQHLVTFNHHKKICMNSEDNCLFYLFIIHYNVIFWQYTNLFHKSWCRHFVFLVGISTLCKKQKWAQSILDDNFFTFSLWEMASLERKVYRIVNNSSLFFLACV